MFPSIVSYDLRAGTVAPRASAGNASGRQPLPGFLLAGVEGHYARFGTAA